MFREYFSGIYKNRFILISLVNRDLIQKYRRSILGIAWSIITPLGLAIIIGWLITAIGMISLALVFQNLTNERSDLDGGIYSYAQAGFGDFIGFASAWGYWFSAFLGNVAYATLLMSSMVITSILL